MILEEQPCTIFIKYPSITVYTEQFYQSDLPISTFLRVSFTDQIFTSTALFMVINLFLLDNHQFSNRKYWWNSQPWKVLIGTYIWSVDLFGKDRGKDLNTQYMTNLTIVCSVKMEYGWNFSLSGLNMMVNCGLEKICLKFLHVPAIFHFNEFTT